LEGKEGRRHKGAEGEEEEGRKGKRSLTVSVKILGKIELVFSLIRHFIRNQV
jgi:hypothetical protein